MMTEEGDDDEEDPEEIHVRVECVVLTGITNTHHESVPGEDGASNGGRLLYLEPSKVVQVEDEEDEEWRDGD